MVTTKLSQVAGKGWGWYSYSRPTPSTDAGSFSDGTSSASDAPRSSTQKPAGVSSSATPSVSSPYKLMEYAQDTVEQTYSSLSNYMSNVGWPGGGAGGGGGNLSDTNSDTSPMDPMILDNMPSARRNNNASYSILASPAVLNLFHNPYVAVRGVGSNRQAHKPSSSMEAIRSLINAVPAIDIADFPSDASSSMHHTEPSLGGTISGEGSSSRGMLPSSTHLSARYQPASVARQSSPSETASQLAEGTLRAFRDIVLDEAVELHKALRYWSYRWERPLLSWLEAGPAVWFSEEGYQHQLVGQKVSQIQAVLARRCATIGDLQSHLLRAGWQQGVAQWGVLGEGGQWATVAGGDGRMTDGLPGASTTPTSSILPPPPPGYSIRRISSEMIDDTPISGRPPLSRKGPAYNVSPLPQPMRQNQLYYANVFVKNNDGGHIMIDDPALAEWSVDAISLVRCQLFRAANGKVLLPYTENWAEGDDQSRLSYDAAGSLIMDNDTAATDETVAGAKLPLWASLRVAAGGDDDDPGMTMAPKRTQEDGIESPTLIQISDLPLLVNEVSELLDIMDSIMQMQRARRLDKLKPQKWWIRNWYLGALAFPPLLYFTYKAAQNGFGLPILRYTAKQFAHFFREHVVDPFFAMYEEFAKGTTDISDREARNVAINNLRKMIRSWLDETHPDMPVKERKRMAKAMDISLIEAEKEESMKTIYNINSVIRMSFIEAQFLKKVSPVLVDCGSTIRVGHLRFLIESITCRK